MSAARNGPDAGHHGAAGPPGDDHGWPLPGGRAPRQDTGSLWRNPVTGPNAFGVGAEGSDPAASWRALSGGYGPDEVFDIADDRRDDGARTGSDTSFPSGPPIPSGRGRHARPDEDDESGTPRYHPTEEPVRASTASSPFGSWPAELSTPSWDSLSSPTSDPLHDPLPASPPEPRSPEPRYAPLSEPEFVPPPEQRYAPPDRLSVPTPSGVSDEASEMVAHIRASFAEIAPRTDELSQLFYGLLFRIAPETRDLFPATMQLQRSRLMRALIHFLQMADRPDELGVFLRQLGRDHRKFGVVAAHYEKVGEALVGAIKEMSGPRWTPEIEQAWFRAYRVLSGVMSEAAEAERGPAVWMARVVEHRKVSPDLAVIRVQTSQPVPYAAGQYVSVEVPQRPRMWRTLSPANAPGSDCVLEFHVHTVPGGWVSRAMVSHASVGEVWRIGPPMGQMTLDPRSRGDLLMVVGGTGLAPARALIEQIMIDGTDRKVALFVGGRTWDSLYDIDTLRRMAQDHPWLTVVPVVEEDGSRYGAETGTLAEVVARYGAWADREVVVSGSPAMVRSTVSAMLDAGTPFMQIHYDPQHTD